MMGVVNAYFRWNSSSEINPTRVPLLHALLSSVLLSISVSAQRSFFTTAALTSLTMLHSVHVVSDTAAAVLQPLDLPLLSSFMNYLLHPQLYVYLHFASV